MNEWAAIPNIDYVGETHTPEEYMSIANLLCLPGYREGFSTLVIEVAAMKVATLGMNITGLEDAVDDGNTGILVPAKSVEKLYQKLRLLLDNQQLCKKLGQAAYERCIKSFGSKKLSKLMLTEYKTLFSDRQK